MIGGGGSSVRGGLQLGRSRGLREKGEGAKMGLGLSPEYWRWSRGYGGGGDGCGGGDGGHEVVAYRGRRELKKKRVKIANLDDQVQQDTQFNFPIGAQHCDILREYGRQMTKLSKRIIKIVLMCLGEDFERKFRSEFIKCHGYLRINNYSLLEYKKQEEAEGLGMHTDMSCVTIVYQDDIGGLQVRSKEGKWMDINPCDGTLVVNIGDLMQAWSNGKLRSSEHRVVLRQSVSRFSLAFFWCFEDDKVILAPDEVVGKGNSRIYKPFVCSEYMKFRENSVKGKFEKVGFTVKDFAGTKCTGG